MNNEEINAFNDLAVFAVRYALGRATYVSHLVPSHIVSNMKYMYPRTLKCIIKDIDSYKETCGQIGWEIDEVSWMNFRQECQKALEEKEMR